MDFSKAYQALKQGKKIKREHWLGYWIKEDNKIMMYCKDGNKLDLTDSEDIFFTIDNLIQDDWVVIKEDNENVKLEVNTFTFGEALRKLKQGKKVARTGWNGKGIFIELQVPDEYSKMTYPYIFIDTTGLKTDNQNAPKNRVPWLASQTDMLSEDWQLVDAE